MTAPQRLAAFLAALAAVGGGAALVGAAVDPVHHDGAAAHDARGHDDGGHGGPETGGGGVPAGLAVAADGLALEARTSMLPRGRAASFAFRITGADGEPVRDFALEHGRRMHLIIVRRDMVLYQHLHPRMDADGTWRVPVRLPEGGVYRAFADFRTGDRKHTLATDLMVAGDFDPQELPPARAVGSYEGYDVTLSAPALRAGRETTLAFRASLPGRSVRLQPYLGAKGHLVALREGDLAYLHVHPAGETGADRVAFGATFPSAGRYRLFLQTKHDGRVRTVAHTVEVTR